jgi:hypothetical protein
VSTFGFGACSVDDRTLAALCAEAGSGSSGSCGLGGSLSGQGGARATGGKSAASSGGAREPGGGDGGTGASSAGDSTIGENTTCPDLDQNTVPDCTETLAANPTFDRNSNGWQAEANTAVSWDAYDAQATEGSGSLVVENRATSGAPGMGMAYGGAKQCVPITAKSTYVVYAQMYSGTSTVSGYGSLIGRLFESADCSGSPIADSVKVSPTIGTVNLWMTLQTDALAAPAGAKSLLVELQVGKLANNTDRVSLRFDNVLVR